MLTLKELPALLSLSIGFTGMWWELWTLGSWWNLYSSQRYIFAGVASFLGALLWCYGFGLLLLWCVQ